MFLENVLVIWMADPKMMAGQTRSNLAHRPMLSKSLVNPLIEEEIERYQGNHRISSDFEQASRTLCKSIGHSNVLSRTPRNARLGSCELETLLKSTLLQKLCRGGMRIDAQPYDRSKPEDRVISPDLEKIEGSSRTDLHGPRTYTAFRSRACSRRVWRVRCEATSVFWFFCSQTCLLTAETLGQENT